MNAQQRKMERTFNKIGALSGILGLGGLAVALSNIESNSIYIIGMSMMLVAGLCALTAMKARARQDLARRQEAELKRSAELCLVRCKRKNRLLGINPAGHWDYVFSAGRWVHAGSSEGQVAVTRSGPIPDRIKFGTDDWHNMYETMELAKQRQ